MGLLCLTILVLLQSLVSAHMIDVVAGKKECFFEDLHKNDKVCVVPSQHHWNACLCGHILLQMTVTYQVGGGGHLDIDFWVSMDHSFGFCNDH